MARGWESKFVEDQINQGKTGTAAMPMTKEEALSDEEKERRARLGSLRLARKHALTSMKASRDERYLALLQRNLDHLDAQISKLEAISSV